MNEPKDVWLTTAGELVDFLEKEIAAGREPKTPEDWTNFMIRMAQEREVKHLGSTTASASYLAGSLRDEGLDVQQLKKRDLNDK